MTPMKLPAEQGPPTPPMTAGTTAVTWYQIVR
jgi:hypothetical protein